MKNIFKKVISFIKHPLVIIFIILGVWIVGLILFFEDALSELPATLLGYTLAIFQTAIFRQYKAVKEDTLKSNQKKQYLKKKYKKESTIILEINKKSQEVFFVDITKGKTNFEFKHRDQTFELDKFISNNYFKIISAHSMSTFNNHLTLRLYDVEDKEDKIIFYTERSDYYKHMVTNRAVDYKIEGNLTLRSMYEPGPKLNELIESKFSNHIGINCLVIFNDNKVIIPHRNNNATYSKNKVTSSIAARLIIDDYNNVDNQLPIKTIKKLLKENYKFSENDILKYEKNINFIGAARTIYEGGKPQFYYALYIDDMSSLEYYQKNNGKCLMMALNSEVDQYKRIYLADIESFDISIDNKLKFNYYDKKIKNKTCNVELSMYVNLFYLKQSSQYNKKIQL